LDGAAKPFRLSNLEGKVAALGVTIVEGRVKVAALGVTIVEGRVKVDR
jgi:hypothetical protein